MFALPRVLWHLAGVTQLSVNLNKVALIRNSRAKNYPNLVQVAKHIIDWGAQGITVHPRPDGRHAKKSDVLELKRELVGKYAVELNVEGFPSPDFLDMVCEHQPDQVTLVPDPPEALTSNAGWAVESNLVFLEKSIARLKNANLRVSVFLDPLSFMPKDLADLSQIGADRIELYTERYAEDFSTPRQQATVVKYRHLAECARDAKLGVNAGHDLNLLNLHGLITAIPWVLEVSIGHALTCEALYFGFEAVLGAYQSILSGDASQVKTLKGLPDIYSPTR